ncbi:hypothetical protein [Poriferisphaera sp. WC338]|uniref:hypothetical protein n=1 Tax=Poriferisphaera sp. WC338 TaxID=3425129 RepID=UPI003D817CD3
MSTTTSKVKRESGTRIDTDLICLQCGYTLRLQKPDAVCPDCGLPILETISNPPLRFTSPDHLRTAKLALLSLMTTTLTCLATPIIFTLNKSMSTSAFFVYVESFFLLIPPLLLLFAICCLQEKPYPYSKKSSIVKLAFLFTILYAGTSYLDRLLIIAPQLLPNARHYLYIFAIHAYLVGLLLLFLHLRKLSAEIHLKNLSHGFTCFAIIFFVQLLYYGVNVCRIIYLAVKWLVPNDYGQWEFHDDILEQYRTLTIFADPLIHPLHIPVISQIAPIALLIMLFIILLKLRRLTTIAS